MKPTIGSTEAGLQSLEASVVKRCARSADLAHWETIEEFDACLACPAGPRNSCATLPRESENARAIFGHPVGGELYLANAAPRRQEVIGR